MKKNSFRIGGRYVVKCIYSNKTIMKSKPQQSVSNERISNYSLNKKRDESFLKDEVTSKMRCQWETAPDAVSLDQPDEKAMWQNITHRIGFFAPSKHYLFYRVYSMVASILLLIGIAGLLFYATSDAPNLTTYVVSTGIRSIDSISLPDGTEVHMGPQTRLSYPSDFISETREVKLEGQAFFNVAKNSKPFIVKGNKMSVQALGTAFEVFDYASDEKKEVILLNGKVKVGIPNTKAIGESTYIMEPGEKLSLNNQNGRVSKENINADKYTAWRNHDILSFENEKLTMIIPRLEQWFKCKIYCSEKIAEECRFTFKVKDETIKQILYLIQVSSPLQYNELKNKDYELTYK